MAEEHAGVVGLPEDEADLFEDWRFTEKGFDGCRDNRRGLFAGIAISAGTNGGEGDGAKFQFRSDRERILVASGEELGFRLAAGPGDGSDSVDNVFCGKVASV